MSTTNPTSPTETPRLLGQFIIHLTEEDVWATYRSVFTKSGTLPLRKDILRVAILEQTAPVWSSMSIRVALGTITILDAHEIQIAAYRPTADCRNRFLNWLMADTETTPIMYDLKVIELEIKALAAECVPQSFTFQLTEKAIGVEVRSEHQDCCPAGEPGPQGDPYPAKLDITILPEDLDRSIAQVQATEARGLIVDRTAFCSFYHAIYRQFPWLGAQQLEVGYVTFRIKGVAMVEPTYKVEEDKRFALEPLTKVSGQDYQHPQNLASLRALLPLTVTAHRTDKVYVAEEPAKPASPYPPSIRLDITKDDIRNAFFAMGQQEDVTQADILVTTVIRQHRTLGQSVCSTYAGLLIDGTVGYVADDASLPAVLLCTSIDLAQYRAYGVLFHHLLAAAPFSVTLHQPNSGIPTEKGKQVLINTVTYARTRGIKGRA